MSTLTVGGKNSETRFVVAFFEDQRPTLNFGRTFRLFWILGVFILFREIPMFDGDFVVKFDDRHSAGHLAWGRKGMALFFPGVAILFPPTVAPWGRHLLERGGLPSC